MANLLVKDANGNTVELRASGAGTPLDPFMPDHFLAAGIECGISDAIVRPANAAVYAGGSILAIGDATPKSLNFANAARINGGTGRVLSVKLETTDIKPDNLCVRLWLYSADPGVVTDQAAWALTTNSSRFAYVDFIEFQSGDAGSNYSEAYGVITGGIFKSAANSRSIYGIPVWDGDVDYVPSSGQIFRFTLLGVEQK